MKFLLITVLICCTVAPVEDTKKEKKKKDDGDTADVMELFLGPEEDPQPAAPPQKEPPADQATLASPSPDGVEKPIHAAATDSDNEVRVVMLQQCTGSLLITRCFYAD